MTTKVVKCSSCNIVINEVLAFVNNKIDVMDEDSIARICISAFSENDILEAKNLLFQSLATTKKKKQRKREGKSLRNIDDIICVLKETDPDEVPIFVARELQKLPPVLFDHVDVTRLLKDLLVIREEVNRIKNDYVTAEQLETVKCDIEQLKLAPINNIEYSINKRRGACLMDSFSCNSGPMGLHPMGEDTILEVEHHSTSSPNGRYRDIVISKDQESQLRDQRRDSGRQKITTSSGVTATVSHMTHASPRPVVITGESVPNIRLGHTDDAVGKTMADVVKEGRWKTVEEREEWKLVQRRRLRNRFAGKIGKAISEPEEKFKAVDIKTPIYIYNVGKEVTENDVIEYVKKRTNISISVEKVKMKVARDYNSYKIYVSKSHLDTFLSDDFWPQGIAFRQYVDFRPRVRRDPTQLINGHSQIS